MDDPCRDARARVERVRQGDDAAARAMFRELYPTVLKIVRTHRPRRTSEEDLVQSVFMKVFSKLDQYSGTVPLEHWVSRVAVNTCINELQRERVRPELRWADLTEEQEEVVRNLAADASELPASQNLAARELVELLLARLDPKDRLIVRMLHLEGRTLEEIRAVTGWNTNLLRVRAFRARAKLKRHLETLLQERTP